jgi:cytoskeletal protein CcmA (bactofilin family)
MRDAGEQNRFDPSLNAMFGPGSVVQGKLSFKGQVRIDGRFKGEIATTDVLIVGENAIVAANIKCRAVVVSGAVTGNIRATESVEMHRPARVKGDVSTPSLSIDQGVVFDGMARMENGGVDLTVEGPNTTTARRKSGRGSHPRDHSAP